MDRKNLSLPEIIYRVETWRKEGVQAHYPFFVLVGRELDRIAGEILAEAGPTDDESVLTMSGLYAVVAEILLLEKAYQTEMGEGVLLKKGAELIENFLRLILVEKNEELVLQILADGEINEVLVELGVDMKALVRTELEKAKAALKISREKAIFAGSILDFLMGKEAQGIDSEGNNQPIDFLTRR